MKGISPVAFSIFGIDIMWYGIVIATGVMTALIMCMKREKRFGFEKDTSLSLVLVALPAGIVCARLYFVVFNLDYYLSNPAEIVMIRNGGLGIYGGIIGGTAGILIYCRNKKLDIGKVLDLIVPGLAAAQAVGRWGNFFNGEAYGTATTIDFFPISVFIEADGCYHLAAFFYESVWCFAVCAVLLIFERNKIFDRPGIETMWYFLLYGAERICVEGLRTDSLMLGPVRISQLASAVMIFVSAVVILMRSRASLRFILPPVVFAAECALAFTGHPFLTLIPSAAVIVTCSYQALEKKA